MKICKDCKKEKDFNLFYTDKRSKDGYMYRCKECEKANVKRRNSTPEAKLKIKQRIKNWIKNNKDKVLLYKENNKQKRNSWLRERYSKDEKYREIMVERAQNYRDNPDNKEKRRETSRRCRINSMKNPKNRMIRNLRRRFSHVLQGNRKHDYTMNMVGCSREELFLHLEKQFKEGMSWENYGKEKHSWCVDHIIPCSYFDLSLVEDQKKCFHYTNLQPKWFLENASKGDRFIG